VRPCARLRFGPSGLITTGCLVAVSAALVTGCATSADPHEGGFVSGVVGIAGGGYARRIEEREGSYQDARDAQRQLEAEARALERERAEVRGDLNRARTRLAAQERRIAAERARITALRQRSSADQARLERLREAQSRIEGARGAVRGVRPEEQSLPDLKSRARTISAELDEIDDMVGAVSGT
jgi:chromosome segregation ATPase